MPIAEMKKIDISALKRDKQQLVAYLQRQGVVELAGQSVCPDRVFALPDCAAEIADLQAKYGLVKKAIEILDAHVPEKASLFAALEGKAVKSVAEYEAFHREGEAVLQIAEGICDTQESMHKARDEMTRLGEKRESLRPWLALEAPLSFRGTRHTAARVGSLPQGYTPAELDAAVAALGAEPERFVFHIVSASKEQTCLVAISMKVEFGGLEDVLGQLQFSPPPFVTDRLPREELAVLESAIRERQALLRTYAETLSALSARREELRFLQDYLSIKREERRAFGQISEAAYAFLLTGYVPAREAERIGRDLTERFGCAVRIEAVEEGDDVPSGMENDWFSEPLESVVASYNYPKYRETDPTKVTSIFYYFMFGLMFSDACYGLILALTCGALLLKFKEMSESASKFLRLFFWCGISTLVWGVVFSSYFGDVVDVFSSVFLGRRISIPPLWFAPLENPMRLLLFCLAIGIVHLTTGYGMNLYAALRQKDIKGALFDAVAPVLLLFALLVVFMGSEMFRSLAGFAITVSPALGNVCFGVAGACALVILLTGGRESRSWVKRLLKGAFALYNVLAGWVSDTLSYSRLLALGLATGVIGSVINTLAAMPGKSVFGFVAFFIIFAAGHAMNFGINILGSYVHSNRLEYVEFYGKFYEGGGRKFSPLKIETQYYTIREDN